MQDLIDELGRLPGVGPKSAQRIAFHILQSDPEDVRRLVHALTEVSEKVRFCVTCGNVSADEQCRICRDPRRDPPSSASSRSRRTSWRSRRPASSAAATTCSAARSARSRASAPTTCGSVSSSPRLASGEVTEIILATDPNLEGEATATYLARLLKPMGLRVTRLASRPAGRGRPGVRRRADARPRFRGAEAARCLTQHRARTPAPRCWSCAAWGRRPRPTRRPSSTPSPRSPPAPSPDIAIPVLLLALSQSLLAGARLGAITDIVPSERFEPDAGPDPDVDPRPRQPRQRLRRARRVRRRRRPADQRRGRARGRSSDDLADVAGRPRARPEALPRRPGRRGAVVVAVLVPVDLGRAGDVRAARAAVDARPPPPRRRRRHRRRRRVRRAAHARRASRRPRGRAAVPTGDR